MSFLTFVSTHLLPVFFVYGLAFFSLGLAASLQQTEGSTFELRDSVLALAAFGFLHGLSEWADMFAVSGDAYWTHLGSRIISFGFTLGPVCFVRGFSGDPRSFDWTLEPRGHCKDTAERISPRSARTKTSRHYPRRYRSL
jgi:hypothetical protein